MKKTLVVLLLTVMIAFAACSRPGGDAALSNTPDPPFAGEPPEEAYVYQGEPGVHGGTLVLSQPSDMDSFNIITATETSSTDILWYHVFRCPIDFHNGGEPADFDNGLCTRYEASPDARLWTFTFRKGVRWSDGHPFTADDVLFTYEVVTDENMSRHTNISSIFQEGVGPDQKPIYPKLEKLDDHTVRFTLSKPNGGFLDSIFNLWLIPRHKWETAFREGRFTEVMKVSDSPADVVGLGPFRIKEHVSGQRIVLERNPYFWKVDSKGQRLPYLDRIIFVIAKDFNAVQAKFQAGEIDAMYRVRAEEYAAVKRLESPEIIIHDLGVTHDTNFLVLNQNTGNHPSTGRPLLPPWKLKLFRDVRFRQAVSYAIDRQGMANTVYSGRGTPIYSFITPADTYWYNDNIMKYEHDPARARQLLAEIGLKDNDGDGVLEDAEGHPVEFNIVVNAENSQRVGMAAFIVNNLREVGIRANSSPMSLNAIAGMIQKTFDFEALVLGWQTGVPPGPTNVMNIVLSSAPLHVCHPLQKTPGTEWEARLDELAYRTTGTADAAERKRLFGEIQRIWSEQLPEINLIAQQEAVAYKSKFGNIRPASLPPRLTWNAEEIYVKR